MELTPRDFRLLKDIALSHVLSRDQILALDYFGTVTRVNTRLRQLRGDNLIKRVETPFFGQSLYAVGSKAGPALGNRISRIVAGRTGSPRFLQHALMLTQTRIALLGKGATAWRFEQQLRRSFIFQDCSLEVRPDGMAVMPSGQVAVEVDLGHVAYDKFAAKLRAYDAFIACGACSEQWQTPSLKVLAVTTSRVRAAKLAGLVPHPVRFDLRCITFQELSVPLIGGWS